jgi:hypothetical protein
MYVASVIVAKLPMISVHLLLKPLFGHSILCLQKEFRLEFDVASCRKIQKLNTVLKRLNGIPVHWSSVFVSITCSF